MDDKEAGGGDQDVSIDELNDELDELMKTVEDSLPEGEEEDA